MNEVKINIWKLDNFTDNPTEIIATFYDEDEAQDYIDYKWSVGSKCAILDSRTKEIAYPNLSI